MKKRLLVFFVLGFILMNLFAERIVISVPYESREQLQEYMKQGYDIAHVNPGKEIHLIINENEKPDFIKKYNEVHVVFTETDMKSNLKSSNDRITGYQSYSQMVQRLEALESSFPNICKVIELGASQGKLYLATGNTNYTQYNHTLYGIKLSRNVEINEDEPNYYFFGNIHAREPLTAEICMNIIENLVSSYDVDNTEHPLNQTQVWVVPVLNPDGRDIVFTQKDIWHRKNVFDNNNNSKFDLGSSSSTSIDGIDINRNFAFKWGTTGISWSYSSDTYPGASPFSAVEAAHVKDFAKKVPFIAGISYHSYGNQVLWPYGYDWDAHSHNLQAVKSLAIELAGLIRQYNKNNLFYQPVASFDLYPASGDSEDYLHHYHNILAYNIETADSFIPSATAVAQIVKDHIPAAMHLLARHKKQFLTGIVSDKITGEPLKAEIKVYPIDSGNPNRMPIYSSEDFGRYHYALVAGNYQLSVTKDNYNTFISDFVITTTGQTIINVQLTPKTAPNCPILETPIANAVNVSVTPLLKWLVDPSGNEVTSFHLQISESADFKNIVVDEPLLQNNEFSVLDDSKLDYNQTFFWRVFAKNSYGVCSETHTARSFSTLPPLPETVILTSPDNYSTDQLIRPTLSWQSPAGTIDGYYVYLSVSENPGLSQANLVQTVNSNTTTFQLNFDLDHETTYHWQIVAFNSAGKGDVSDSWKFVTEKKLNADDYLASVMDTELFSNYPNPFNPTTTISFVLRHDGLVSIEIFNIRGQKIRSLANSFYRAGKHNIIFNGKDDSGSELGSGLYLCRMTTDGYNSTKRLLLIK